MTSDDPLGRLGAFLTAHEAERLAAALQAGEPTSSALKEVNRTRRPEAGRLLHAAGLGHQAAETSAAVLRAIAGARSVRTTITPVWTMPGPQTSVGRLTGEVLRLIDAARIAVTCASYNFTSHSAMWTALADASQRPEMAVTVYVDASAGTPQHVADHLRHATVLQTITSPNKAKPLVSHAKFVVIDHAVVLTTSANFSHSAENSNIELGLLIHDTALAESIEQTMRSQHGSLYQRIIPSLHG